MDLALRIVLERPTPGVDFGLQSGHGSTYEVIQMQRSNGKDLKFELTLPVKPGRKDDLPHFSGPLVQGPAGDKFVYINIGTYAGQSNTHWSRRLKITLNDITWEMMKAGRVLVANIPGTGKDGGPSCASNWRKQVGPDWGWRFDK
jgi:uncharacterized protein DUF5990